MPFGITEDVVRDDRLPFEKHGTRNKLSTILKKEFGTEEGAENFFAFDKEHGIEYQPQSIF